LRNVPSDSLCETAVCAIIQTVTTVDEAHEGLRERKKARTRRALEDAALDLFRRNGFEHTTVEQIADACEVSPRTFFRYFATKEEALFGDSGEKLETFVAALETSPADEPPLRSLRAAAQTVVAMQEGHRDRLKARKQIIADTPSLRARGAERQDEWNDAAVQILTRRGGEHAGATHALEIRLVVTASTAAIHAAVQTWLDEASTDLGKLVDAAFDRLAAGFGG
jgi:TetR/AcrR family transcriptional regulator, regulator of mycofactocin system